MRKLEMSEPADVGGEQFDRQVVILHLAGEAYGLDIEYVETVIVPQPITKIPQASPYILGVINLRGNIVPLVDLRMRLGFPAADHEDAAKERIMIVGVEGLAAALTVDSVSEVLRIANTQIQAPDGLIASAASDCVTGIVTRTTLDGSEGLILLLDIEKVLGPCLQSCDKEPAA